MTVTKTIQVRRARASDVDIIEHFIDKIAAFHGDTYQKNADFILGEAFGTNPELEICFAQKGQSVVGFCVIYWEFALHMGLKRLHLHLFYVDEDRRGTGIDRTMMDVIERRAKEQGASMIVVGAELWNEAAQQTYLALGFERRPVIGAFFKKPLV